MQKALLRLFNSVLIDGRSGKAIPAEVQKRAICNGFILDPRVEPSDEVLAAAEEVLGLSGEKANAGFHKSWQVILESGLEDLVAQQALHYLTTYGFEELGIYRQSTVFIPREVLDAPDFRSDIPLVVVRPMSRETILSSIVDLGSGVALAEQTLDDIVTVVRRLKYGPNLVGEIRNRELKARLYDLFDIAPSEPEEYLRYLISRLTNQSLVIKNEDLIEKLKGASGETLDAMLDRAPEDLGAIFFRYKPLFLAMKKISSKKGFFNRLRKAASRQHKPSDPDYLNTVTEQLGRGSLRHEEFVSRLRKAGTYRKVRLAQALNFRLNHNGSIVYRIRNGRGWATSFGWSQGQEMDRELAKATKNALGFVMDAIARDIRPSVEGRSFFIPSNVSYGVPTSEKQFAGNLPAGTSISVPGPVLVGIHWFNSEKRRVDLDLSILGQSGKYGWDGDYRSDDRGVLFSGDVTDAPRPVGATEFFHLRPGSTEPRILTVNDYNYLKEDPVECRIIVARGDYSGELPENYLVDVNKIVAQADIYIERRQTVLGVVVPVNGGSRIFFSPSSIGNTISVGAGPAATHARKYLVAAAMSSFDLRDVLEMAGARLVHELEGDHVIDLSPQRLDKTTIVNLLNAGS